LEQQWFKKRGYRHFDAPVGRPFASLACDRAFVARHSWLPLIHYVKRVKRYQPLAGRTIYKDRDIMIASHRDACILTKYAYEASKLLEQSYAQAQLDDHVIAYRKLGLTNYDFSAKAYRFAQDHQPCVVLCFDITAFFDNLDHAILKDRLKRLLDVKELSPDWYAVFRHVTKFSKTERKALQADPVFSRRLEEDGRRPIATIAELHKAGIAIVTNPNRFGIPQGTPISSVFSNLYMRNVDVAMAHACATIRGFYQRYSDDILVVCPVHEEAGITETLKAVIAEHKLTIKDEKTERAEFGAGSDTSFQYLGFNMSKGGASIRPSSMARQWRKARRAIKKTAAIGKMAIAEGRADKIFTKRLRKRFSPVGARNFAKYARRAAYAFGSRKIVRQAMKLERMVDQAIRDMEEP